MLDGNYNRTQPIKWRRVTTIIWLDYSLSRVLLQVTRRAMGRCLSKAELWPGTGNRETFRRSFFDRESIILWSLQTHAENRAHYEACMSSKDLEGVSFLRFRHPSEAEIFLKALEP